MNQLLIDSGNIEKYLKNFQKLIIRLMNLTKEQHITQPNPLIKNLMVKMNYIKIKRIEQLGKFSSYTSPEIEALKKQAGVSEIRSYVGGYDLLIHTNKSDSGIVTIDVYPSTYSFSVGSADMIDPDKVRFLLQLIKKLQASMKRSRKICYA